MGLDVLSPLRPSVALLLGAEWTWVCKDGTLVDGCGSGSSVRPMVEAVARLLIELRIEHRKTHLSSWGVAFWALATGKLRLPAAVTEGVENQLARAGMQPLGCHVYRLRGAGGRWLSSCGCYYLG